MLKVRMCRMVLPYTPRRDTQNHALPLFVNPDDSPDRYPAPPLGMTVGSEIKKLIVSTCRSIVKLEASLKNLEARSTVLQQHRIDGTIPKDLLLKTLLEDHQPQMDEIRQTAMNSLQEDVRYQVSQSLFRVRLTNLRLHP